jgi:hypothetical protein
MEKRLSAEAAASMDLGQRDPGRWLELDLLFTERWIHPNAFKDWSIALNANGVLPFSPGLA